MEYIRVLIAFASKHGSTAEIAGHIGYLLADAGMIADVIPAADVLSLDGYDAVIVGSAVYTGRWRPEATKFLERFAAEMVDRPVWLFSSGPTGHGDPVELLDGWELPNQQADVIDRIQPRETALFHGALDRKKLNFLEKWMVKLVNAPTGDFRDWDQIEAWAEQIAHQLALEPLPL